MVSNLVRNVPSLFGVNLMQIKNTEVVIYTKAGKVTEKFHGRAGAVKFARDLETAQGLRLELIGMDDSDRETVLTYGEKEKRH